MTLHCGPPNELLRCGLVLHHHSMSHLLLMNVGWASLKQMAAGHSSHTISETSCIITERSSVKTIILHFPDLLTVHK